ncbi:unnamed protein product [Amoebophrya sp. A120]|nr:unnamed protein product [Amoebophrya sp. A120]|eukprot:GSA120T00008874001.1
MRENKSKRIQGNIVRLVAKNLGVMSDETKDIEYKIKKAWKAYHTLAAHMAGIQGLTNKRRGELIPIMLRTILTYGLTSRYVRPEEVKKLEGEEIKFAMRLLQMPLWVKKSERISDAEIRRRLKLPPLGAHLRFLQLRHIGHILRKPKEDFTRKALLGYFVPAMMTKPTDFIRSVKNLKELGPKSRCATSLLEDCVGYMQDKCGLSSHVMEQIFMSPEECAQARPDLKGPDSLHNKNKRLFYVVTRWQHIRECVADWSKSEKRPAEKTLLDEEHLDYLAIKYFGTENGPKTTRAQIRKDAVAGGYDPAAMLAGYDRPTGAPQYLYRAKKCPWCSPDASEFGARSDDEWRALDSVVGLPPEFLDHVSREHAAVEPKTDRLDEAREYNEDIDGEKSAQIRREIIQQHECLREKPAKGRLPRGRTKRVPQITCTICSRDFTSSAGAMALHAQAHENEEYQTLGQIYRTDATTGERFATSEFRPQQHIWDEGRGKFTAGSDAHSCAIIIPRAAEYRTRHNKMGIKCRKCTAFRIQLQGDDEDQLHYCKAVEKKVEKMKKREKWCKGKKFAFPLGETSDVEQ